MKPVPIRRHIRLLGLLALLLAAACARAPQATVLPPAAPTAVPTLPAPTLSRPTAVAPATDAAPSPAATTAPPPTSTAEPETNTATLLGYDWDDRAPFRAGLRPGEEAALDELSGATMYQLKLDITSPRKVTAQMAARYTNQESEPLDELVLHLFPGSLGGAMRVSNVRLDEQAVPALSDGDVLRVPLSAPLAPGGTTVLELEFVTTVPGPGESTKYQVLADVDGTLALAHFYPMFAVYDADGWHSEPSAPHGDETFADSSFYLVEVTAPAAQTVVTSGVTVAEQQSGGLQQITVAAGPVRDFYLAANEAYRVVSQEVDGVEVNSYAPRERLDGAALALETAVAALQSYETRLGTYPFSELDIVSTPTRALGIEYPGIFANAERIYDLSGTTGGRPNAIILESTTAHEAAHQWFYSLVGNDQLNEPWLDESLTQYATYLYYVDRYGEANAQGFFSSLEGRWESAENRDLPIGLAAEAYGGQDYGAIVYGRGPLFIHELAQEMGQETFDAFLRDYNARYRYQIASAAEFRALAETWCACDLGPLFAAWVDPAGS